MNIGAKFKVTRARAPGDAGAGFVRAAKPLLFSVLLSAQIFADDLIVANASDTVNGNTSTPAALVANPGPDGISLREAINACNNAAGPHTIAFAATLNGQSIALASGLRVSRNGIALIGNLGADGKPAVTLKAPAAAAAPIMLEVIASDFSLSRLRLSEIRQVFGLRIRAGANAPQAIANIRVAECEFVAGGANINNNAISVGVEEAAVGASISGVGVVGNSFLHFAGEGDGIHIPANGRDCVIENIRIEGNYFEDNAYPVELTPSNGATNNRIQATQVLRNTFVGNSQAISFYVGHSAGRPVTTGNVIADTVIADNLFIDNNTDLNLGSGSADTRDNQVLRTQILRNTFTGTRGGILLKNPGGPGQQPATHNLIADTSITENLLTNNSGGIVVTAGAANTTGCLITGTRIVRNRITSQNGLVVALQFFDGSAANQIADTIITQNLFTGGGIALGGSDGITAGNAILNTDISSNVISAAQRGAAVSMFINAGASNTRIDGVAILNNTIADNALRFPAVTGGIGGSGNTITGVKVRNTLLWNNPGGDVANLPFFSDVSYCLTNDPQHAGRNDNIAADPKFADAANGDYHLRAGSPAIDAGTSEGTPTSDLDGRPRFDDPATANTGAGTARYFDLGAYEFAPVSSQGRLVNLSVLTALESAAATFAVGTVLGGNGTGGAKSVLVRAVGPSLTPLGVGGALADPRLDLYSGQTVAASNDDWGGTAALVGAFRQAGAFAFASAGSRDAAVTYTAGGVVSPQSYTVRLGGNGGTGAVLAEVYDTTSAAAFTVTTPRLINLSVLKNVGAGITTGFVVSGATPVRVLVRAIGPTLARPPFNVPGAMTDPKLELFDGQPRSLAGNNDWQGAAELTTAFAQVGAFALDANSSDAALVRTLAPGNYTVQVAPASGATGIALVEIYEVP